MKLVFSHETVFSKFQPVEILKHSKHQRECQNVVKKLAQLKNCHCLVETLLSFYGWQWWLICIKNPEPATLTHGHHQVCVIRFIRYRRGSIQYIRGIQSQFAGYRKDLLCMPAHRVLCTYCLSCPFKAVADDTLMTSGQDPLTSGNQSSLLTFAVIHFHIITLFLPSEYVSPGFPLFSDHLFPQHATIMKFVCHVESNTGIW